MSEEKYSSPTGRFIFHIDAWEARTSHWIESFTLVEATTGSTVLALQDSAWSLDHAKWIGDAVVKMQLRKYPGDHRPSSFEMKIDCDARMAELASGPPVCLERLERALEARYLNAKMPNHALQQMTGACLSLLARLFSDRR